MKHRSMDPAAKHTRHYISRERKHFIKTILSV